MGIFWGSPFFPTLLSSPQAGQPGPSGLWISCWLRHEGALVGRGRGQSWHEFLWLLLVRLLLSMGSSLTSSLLWSSRNLGLILLLLNRVVTVLLPAASPDHTYLLFSDTLACISIASALIKSSLELSQFRWDICFLTEFYCRFHFPKMVMIGSPLPWLFLQCDFDSSPSRGNDTVTSD